MRMDGAPKRRWRPYETSLGHRPTDGFLEWLLKVDEDCYRDLLVGMSEVKEHGLVRSRHLRGDIYEVRASGATHSARLLFAQEGSRGQVLLALEGLDKKTQKTPPATIALAEQRLDDWRRRGRLKRHGHFTKG